MRTHFHLHERRAHLINGGILFKECARRHRQSECLGKRWREERDRLGERLEVWFERRGRVFFALLRL
jgi:hypothetical protein